jgi:hypothetical protein
LGMLPPALGRSVSIEAFNVGLAKFAGFPYDTCASKRNLRGEAITAEPSSATRKYPGINLG